MLESINPQQQPILQNVLDTADQVFTYIFLMEMLLKWVALGFRKYFSSFWCWLDFIALDVRSSSVSQTTGSLSVTNRNNTEGSFDPFSSIFNLFYGSFTV